MFDTICIFTLFRFLVLWISSNLFSIETSINPLLSMFMTPKTEVLLIHIFLNLSTLLTESKCQTYIISILTRLLFCG